METRTLLQSGDKSTTTKYDGQTEEWKYVQTKVKLYAPSHFVGWLVVLGLTAL